MAIIVGATTWQVKSLPLGLNIGGFIICKSGGVTWVVGPKESEVSRTNGLKNDSSIKAQNITSCTGWFLPTIAQMINPGYECRNYWDAYSNASYWTSSSWPNSFSGIVNMANGNCGGSGSDGATVLCSRSFRCIVY